MQDKHAGCGLESVKFSKQGCGEPGLSLLCLPLALASLSLPLSLSSASLSLSLRLPPLSPFLTNPFMSFSLASPHQLLLRWVNCVSTEVHSPALSYSSQQYHCPILQMGKPRHRGFKWLGQGHTAVKWQLAPRSIHTRRLHHLPPACLVRGLAP